MKQPSKISDIINVPFICTCLEIVISANNVMFLVGYVMDILFLDILTMTQRKDDSIFVAIWISVCIHEFILVKMGHVQYMCT